MTPSITLIGPGAIGTALAAGLIQAGHTPTIVARTPFDRLHVEWPDTAVDAEVSCLSSSSELKPVDIVIVATKATQNAAVVDHVRAATRTGSIVVVAQNGIDHLRRFTDIGKGVVVVPAIPMLPAHRRAPGDTVVVGKSKLVIPAGPEAEVIRSIFKGATVDIEASGDWISAAWLKLILNAASGGMGVLTRRGSEIFVDVEAQALLLELMEEVAAVGRAEGAKLAEDLPAQFQRRSIANAGRHTASIVVDRIGGTPTEWRERNDIVVRVAAKHGIDVPANRMVAMLIRLGEPDPEYITST
jgi:2-dehydropantoate 2-reductase